MANGKKSFMFYCDWDDPIRELGMEKGYALVLLILDFVNDRNPVPTDPVLKAIFPLFKNQLERDLKKWKVKSKQNRENALKRWNAIESKGMRTHANDAKHADIDTVTDTVIDIEKRKLLKEKIAFEECSPSNNEMHYFKDFLEYWFEHGTNDKKMRFEKQKSFNWNMRWSRWKKNQKKWEKDSDKPKMLSQKMKLDHGIK